MLYQLAEDPGERVDLAAARPATVQRLLSRLLQHAAALQPAARLLPNKSIKPAQLVPGWCEQERK